LLLCILQICFSISDSDESSQLGKRRLFNAWKLKFNKTYSSTAEESACFTNFQLSLTRVRSLQISRSPRKHEGAKFGLTKFADLTVDEFKSIYLLPKKITPKKHKVAPKRDRAAPTVFDWRNTGMVTAVKNQEECGSCWAFSATETIESAWMLKHNLNNLTMSPLSPQQIVDCDNMDSGCGGGNPTTAYQYVISQGGIETNKKYPYTGQDGTCNFQQSDVYAKINNWNYACSSEDEPTLLQNTYTYGALSICVDAANWQDYESGIMTAWQCAWIDMLDHCVQAVGWNLQQSTPYWSVRNSWNTDWGENGYIRLEYGANTCGLTELATYVLSN